MPEPSRLIQQDWDELAPKVQAGVEYLDERFPAWRDQIAPAELDMADCHMCVLGQQFGDYFTGLKELNLGTDGFTWAPDRLDFLLGFNIDDLPRDDTKWETLNHLWARAIKGIPLQPMNDDAA